MFFLNLTNIWSSRVVFGRKNTQIPIIFFPIFPRFLPSHIRNLIKFAFNMLAICPQAIK